jgi:hypothetical protein
MKYLFTALLSLSIIFNLSAQNIKYSGSWGDEGFSLQTQSSAKVQLNFSIENFIISSQMINGKSMMELSLPGVMLPNDEGAPNLPGTGRYIAIPEGAEAILNIVEYRSETYENIDLAPAPRIPWDDEDGPLDYTANNEIYSKDAFYPENPILLSEKTEIRGVDAVMLGITPFQYNPVTKQLIVYRDLKIEVNFENGSGHFGEDRLRSRWWDPLMSDIFLNEASLPKMNYNQSFQGKDLTGCEYLIITPTNPEFLSWADSIKQFRTMQGIYTDVVTLDEIGSNSTVVIENYINSAYNSWDVVPAAVLLLGDYGTNSSNSIISPIWDNYCVSDHIYADVTGNDQEDIVFARITANNAEQLETMISKFLNYERTPPTDPDFYNHPITALGWQTERWFQICSETVGGFMKNELGKDPVRINEVYGGNPNSDPWSTATNTNTVLNIFGPNGLGYIPASPTELGNWSGGSAADVADAINAGSFMLQHRDHGFEQGWGEPAFVSNTINSLTNTDLSFIFSINCLTGKYNLSGECFTEKFHRYKYNGMNAGALGLIAASEVSYSFVNDTYVWGIYDNLWPNFLPQYGSNPGYRGFLPAFGNVAGKYFLKASSWPYNTGNKEVTYNLFHHHGDAFLTVYTEVPQDLTVLHDNVLLGAITSFTMTADTAALIGLTVNGELIASATATGEAMTIEIPGQTPGDQMVVTVTKQDYYRYQEVVEVISPDIPYVVYESYVLEDNSGNNDGFMDYGESISLNLTMANIGLQNANGITVEISSDSDDITFTDDTEVYGNFNPQTSVNIVGAFAFDVANDIPDNLNIVFNLSATDGSETWESQFVIKSHAPILEFVDYTVDDASGNNNGRMDPGETVEITVSLINSGSSEAYNVMGALSGDETFFTVNTSSQSFGNMAGNVLIEKTYNVTCDISTPEGLEAEFELEASADMDISGGGTFNTIIGKYTALILDLDPENYSGPGIFATFNDMDMYAVYTTNFPDDLDLYKNIFVSLGLHFTNHELTQTEGQKLKTFLLNGGNIYMEGRTTWFDDAITPVHSMFSLNSIEDTWYEFTGIKGVWGTFTNAMNFDYDANNPYGNYYIAPEGTAFSLFEIPETLFGCGVANDAGDYKTIGTTFEFGELVDGESPSTKAELMQLILNWFDGVITNVDGNSSFVGKDRVMSIYPNPSSEITSIHLNILEDSDVQVAIYNIHGELIQTLIDNKHKNAGEFELTWNRLNQEGNSVHAGVYFIVLNHGNYSETQKLIVID